MKYVPFMMALLVLATQPIRALDDIQNSPASSSAVPEIVEHTPASASPATGASGAAATQPSTIPAVQPTPVPGPLDIRDNGRFFSPALVENTNAVLDRIQHRFGKQVVIETYQQVPADRLVDFDRYSRPEFFKRWVADRAKDRATDGILILVCRNPGRVQMAAGADTQKKAFTQLDIDTLNNVMAVQFHKRDFDEGLRQGVKFIERRLEENLKK